MWRLKVISVGMILFEEEITRISILDAMLSKY